MLVYLGVSAWLLYGTWRAGHKGLGVLIVLGCLALQLVAGFGWGVVCALDHGELTAHDYQVAAVLSWTLILSSWVWLGYLKRHPVAIEAVISEVIPPRNNNILDTFNGG